MYTLFIVIEISLLIIMSRKDFSNLSECQKRRIVLHDSNILNACESQKIKKVCTEEINNAICNNSNSDSDTADINNCYSSVSYNENKSDATDCDVDSLSHVLSSEDT